MTIPPAKGYGEQDFTERERKMAKKKEPRTTILEYLGWWNRPKSSISKEKAAIFKDADERIQGKQNTVRTSSAIKSGGEEIEKMSDPYRDKQKIAAEVRRKLALLNR